MSIEAGRRLEHPASSLHVHLVTDPDNEGPAPRVVQFYEVDELPDAGPACPRCGRDTLPTQGGTGGSGGGGGEPPEPGGAEAAGVPNYDPAAPDGAGWPYCSYPDCGYSSNPVWRGENGEAALVIKRTVLIPQEATDEAAAAWMVEYAAAERFEQRRREIGRVRIDRHTELQLVSRSAVAVMTASGGREQADVARVTRRVVDVDGAEDTELLVVLAPDASAADALREVKAARRRQKAPPAGGRGGATASTKE